ncbi:MAG: nicotinate-nucleotide--dimethylbenzimidazole phosphoribosyltransferase [Gordonia sp. (in: high G+C Gram-positive bacteria)]
MDQPRGPGPRHRGVRTLVLGGVRSGKSAHAQDLLAGHPAVRFLATGPTTTTDADWVARIRGRRAARAARFTTVETTALTEELRTHDAPTLVDDLGTWLAARLDATDEWMAERAGRADENAELCSAISGFTSDLVVISPEAGLAPVPPTPAGRRFQDELGVLNAAVAAVCDRVLLVVAGRVVELPGAMSSPPSGRRSDAPVPVAPASETPVPADDATVVSVPAPTPDRADATRFPPIDPPDEAVAAAARTHHRTVVTPAGALARLADIGVWVSACQGICPPRPIEAPAVVVFAGDHGVAQAGVSAYPPAMTARLVAAIAAGGAAVNVLAGQAGASVRVVDMAVDADTAPELSTYKVRRGSGDLRETDALTDDEARAAVAAGRAIVDGLVDSGTNLLIAGDIGVGNTTPSSVLVGTLTRNEPVVVVGRGSGIDDEGWMRKTAAIRDGMRRAKPHRRDPLALLRAVGGADLAALTGFLAQAAVRRTPVILDGLAVTAAALLAAELAPGAPRWWLAGHRSTEPAHALALAYLDLVPVLDLGMSLGAGSGALLAAPMVISAVELMTSPATGDDAGVDGPPNG